MTMNQRRKVVDKLLPIITFLIGLGLGEALRRLALYLGHSNWITLLYTATKLGIVAYMFWLGLKNWAEVTEMEEEAERLGAKGCKITMHKLLCVFFWLLAVATAFMLF